MNTKSTASATVAAPRRARRSGRPRPALPSAGPGRADEGHKHKLLKPVPEVIDLSEVDLDELDLDALEVDTAAHLTLNGPRAATARDVDPLASGLFALLRNDCHADRLLVWQELANTLDAALNDDGQLALAAARLCCADLQLQDPTRVFAVEPLSEREYEQWLMADPGRKRSWPSVSSVRRWLGGSWLRVLKHLGQMPAPSTRARQLSALLGGFAHEELAAQLKLCRQELSGDPQHPLDYVSQREHREWALRRFRDPDLPLPRLCLQPKPFRDAFGSWPEAVAASGGLKTEAGRRRAASIKQSGAGYTADACIDATRYVGDRAGGAAMSWKDYDRAVRAFKKAAEPPVDLPAILPAAQTIVSRLGSWPQALHLAGFINETERDRRLARVTVTLSDGELLDALARALRTIGADAPKSRYRRYRELMRAKQGPRVGLPSLASVYQRLGSWPEAKAVVIEAFPDVADCVCRPGLRRKRSEREREDHKGPNGYEHEPPRPAAHAPERRRAAPRGAVGAG